MELTAEMEMAVAFAHCFGSNGCDEGWQGLRRIEEACACVWGSSVESSAGDWGGGAVIGGGDGSTRGRGDELRGLQREAPSLKARAAGTTGTQVCGAAARSMGRGGAVGWQRREGA